MKRLIAVVGVIGVVLITLFGLARLWLLWSLAPLGGREPLTGLGDSVLVLWDSLAVPHVTASSDSDLFAALGYLHARDRLWQMDLLRHAAEGRLSELFGKRTIADDKALRERELPRIAGARLAAAGAESRRAVEAYTRGVNAWLAAGRAALEFRLIGHTPEPWTARHSLELGVLQAWDLRTTGDELELADVARRLGAERARDLLPDPGEDGPTILTLQGSPAPGPASSVGTHAVAGSPFASNSWVISGARTASGKPILANDPHLTLRAPSIWYLVGAHAPTYEVVGATIPGVPAVVLGHTTRVAWGFTNAMVDDVDYVALELSADSARYRASEGWAPVDVVAETLLVRGDDPVVYRRLRTAHGPVVTTEWDPEPARALALRWTAQGTDSDELAALFGMARAHNWRDFGAALTRFRSPEQNVVYADAGGDIAYWLAGRVPVRRGGETGHWVRYLEPATLPHGLNPAAGWIVTANNRVVGRSYPHFLSRHYDLPYRAARIRELLAGDGAATSASVSRHQMDLVDLFARAHHALAARAAQAVGRSDLADRLRAWTGTMQADLVEPAIFWSWYRELQRLTYDDESADYRPAAPLHRWMAEGESPWFDDVRTPERETLDTLAHRAMTLALAGRRAVPWGEMHQTVMDHPFAAVPALGRLLRFRIGPLRTGGSNYTVNNSTSLARQPPFTSSYGPSLRHVVDFGDPDGTGGFILPAGQSGHPLSPHYRDQTERWLRGELWVLPIDVRRVRAIDTLVLVPRAEKNPPGFPLGGLARPTSCALEPDVDEAILGSGRTAKLWQPGCLVGDPWLCAPPSPAVCP